MGAHLPEVPLTLGGGDQVCADDVLEHTDRGTDTSVVRVAKAADALRLGGVLATVATHHVAGGSDAFFVEVQDCYERFDPSTSPGLRPPTAADIPEDSEVRTGSDRFGPAVFRRYEREIAYSTTDYLDLLCTYSGHRALPSATRNGLLDCIGRLIDSRHGGRVTKRHLTELRVSRRRH